MQNKGDILIIEDDLDIRNVVVDILKMEGLATAVADNGAEALIYLKTHKKPCMVFLDMMMPVMNGRQFLDIFRNQPGNADVPVVILSAVADRVDTTGANEFIKKPLDLNRLLEVVSKYC